MMESAPFSFRRLTIWIGRLVLGGIFVYAGFSKLFLPNTHLWPMFMLKFSVSTNLATFAQQVESYKIISAEASQTVAHTLPFVEIALGLLLLIGWRLRIWATAITVVMVGFLGVVTRAYLLHMDINCGCFGVPEPLTGMTVLRDSLFTGLALLMTVFAFIEARQPHPWSAPEKA
ncbi:MAG TPA: MauE/DoxX family redox-associated membrane protein [Candidatus Angelobacter sp.]|nr:MauE/DoxX family redox-associated membrane protein [Candidatus Angelobacter sp.]